MADFGYFTSQVKFNRERGLASAWMKHTVQRQLSKAYSKGYALISASQSSLGGLLQCTPTMEVAGPTCIQRLVKGTFPLVKAEVASLEEGLKYYVSTQDESNNSVSYFSLKHRNMGG